MKPSKQFERVDASTVRGTGVELGGERRTSWPASEESPLYTTDTGTAGDRVIVAETAADIQAASDALDGRKSGRPGGGRIQLKRRVYEPAEPIVLKRGVSLVGAGAEHVGDGETTGHSVVSGTALSRDEPVIRTHDDGTYENGQDGRAVTIRDLVVTGDQDGYADMTHGIFVDNTANVWIDGVTVRECYGHGLWIDGGFNAYVSNSSIEGGDTRNAVSATDDRRARSRTYGTIVTNGYREGNKPGTQMKAHRTTFVSTGYDGEHGSDAFHFLSSTLKMTGCRLTVHNSRSPSSPGVAAFRRATESKGGSSPPGIGGGTRIVGRRERGVDGIATVTNVGLSGVTIEGCDVGYRQTKGSQNNKIANTRVADCLGHGIYLDSGSMPQLTDITVTGVGGSGIVWDNGDARNSASNVHVTDCGRYGLQSNGVPRHDDIVVVGGHLAGNDSGPIDLANDFFCRQVSGYTNRTDGQATVGAGSTRTTVTHGLDDGLAGLRDVHVTPVSAPGGASDWWVADAGGGTFDIVLDAAPGQDVTLGWRARGKSAVRK